MIKYCTLILTVCLFSCTGYDNPNQKKDTKVRADLVQSSDKDSFLAKELFIDKGGEEGWGADVRLSITEVSKTDTCIIYFANSLYDKKNIGFKITIPTSTPKSEQELAQVLTLQSSGIISDNFIQTLSKLYKQKADTTLHFIASKRIAFIDLNEFAKAQFGQEPANKTTVKEMKVFFESENPDDNAELYININESERWIEIGEKDQDYRKQVIKGLTTK